eukprot:118565-Chlamydomonas_euryale.AAC.6
MPAEAPCVPAVADPTMLPIPQNQNRLANPCDERSDRPCGHPQDPHTLAAPRATAALSSKTCRQTARKAGGHPRPPAFCRPCCAHHTHPTTATKCTCYAPHPGTCWEKATNARSLSGATTANDQLTAAWCSFHSQTIKQVMRYDAHLLSTTDICPTP